MGGGGSKEVTIRHFSGDDNVDNYVAEVEVAIVMFSLSDTEAANNVARALTGKTGLWFENLKKEQPDATASWIKLKARVSFIIALANFNACLRTSRSDYRDRVTQNPHDMKKTNIGPFGPSLCCKSIKSTLAISRSQAMSTQHCIQLQQI